MSSPRDELNEPISEYPECMPAVTGDSDPPEDIESEPRQRWRPREELLRALEEARRDLKPGEESLYWDWTKTRDSAPEAEDLRPSGEGEVLVSDKDAAAAYVAPKEVAPAVTPRSSTKSRIRVRPDVDPRRQNTVRTSRADGAAMASHRVPTAHQRRTVPSGSHRLKKPVAPPPTPEVEGDAPAAPQVSTGPIDFEQPMFGQERRRRVAWAFFFGMLTGIIVFFWLRVPRDPGGGPAVRPALSASPSGSLLRFEPTRGLAPPPVPPDASTFGEGRVVAAERGPVTLEATAAPAPAPSRGDEPVHGGGAANGGVGAPPPAPAPAPVKGPGAGAAGAATGGGAAQTGALTGGAAGSPGASPSFLIRKKGSPAQ